jgi:hypothetical protein
VYACLPIAVVFVVVVLELLPSLPSSLLLLRHHRLAMGRLKKKVHALMLLHAYSVHYLFLW